MSSKEEYLSVMEESTSICQVLTKIYSSRSSAYYRTYHNNVKRWNLYMEHENLLSRRDYSTRNSISNDDLFVRGVFQGTKVRERELKYKLLPYICVECLQEPVFRGKKLLLQLDHIDGDRTNNELSNLRFMCPNCHSQTDTYGSKNFAVRDKVPKQKKLKIEKVLLPKEVKPHKRKFEVSKEDLQRLIQEMPMTKIGEMFGVSDNAVKKRAKLLGLELKPMRGHWAKVYAGL